MFLSLKKNLAKQSDKKFQGEPNTLHHEQIQEKQQPYIEENKRYRVLGNHKGRLPQYLKNEQECELCNQPFNLSMNVPMMICHNQHNCCLHCAKLHLKRKAECPFCRVQVNIYEVKKSRIVANIIENQAKKRGKKLQVNPNPQRQLFNHINGGERQVPQHREAQIRADQVPLIEEAPLQEVPPLQGRDQDAHVPRDTFCQRLKIVCNDGLYQLIVFLVICNVLFTIFDLIYGFSLEQQRCIDEAYSHDFSLRSWLKLSGLLGLLMFLATLFGVVVFIGMFGDRHQIFPRVVAIIVLILQIFKIFGWNIFGLVLNIKQKMKMKINKDAVKVQ